MQYNSTHLAKPIDNNASLWSGTAASPVFGPNDVVNTHSTGFNDLSIGIPTPRLRFLLTNYRTALTEPFSENCAPN